VPPAAPTALNGTGRASREERARKVLRRFERARTLGDERPHQPEAPRPARWPIALDVAMLATAAIATRAISLLADKPTAHIVWDTVFAILVLIGFGLRGLYRKRIRPVLLDDVRTVTSATAVATMGVISVRVVLTDDLHLAAQTAQLWVVATVCLLLGRGAVYAARKRVIANGGGKPTLIVGAGRVGNLVARRLLQRPEFGLRPVGFLDHEPLELNGQGAHLPVLGASWDLEDIVKEHGVEQAIFTFSTAPHSVLLGMVRRCQELGVTATLVPRLFEVAVERVSVEHLGGVPLFEMRPANPKGWQFLVKYSLDRIAAAVLLLLIAPLMLCLAVAARLSIGSPIFFRQRRVGLDDREFEILKFRTMKNVDSKKGEISISLPDDTAPGGVEGEDRRTRVGRFLRKTSLDELPQLFNVLRGEMSMIGPRPERPEFVELFQQDVHRYTDRHRVKSGITGWAQIHGLRGQTSISDRAEWDNYYIENWSLWLDFKIALMTLPCLARGLGD
jgi:exopolysaccharide biosynthesis polyprenyl glycosylphosphotransferase